jgi:hypothetical protein
MKPFNIIQVANRYEVPAIWLMNTKPALQTRPVAGNDIHQRVGAGYEQEYCSGENKKYRNFLPHFQNWK